MSMELYVLFAMQDAPNLEGWKAALSEHRVPVSISEVVDLRTHSGFLPMHLQDRDTGLEFLIEDYANLAAHFPALKEASIVDPVVFSLGFGGDVAEAAVVFYSAYVLSVTFHGVVLEPQGGTFVGADTLLQSAKHLSEMAAAQ